VHEPMTRIEQATESTLAKVVARFAVPLLIAIIGWFTVTTLTHIQTEQGQQGKDIAQIKSDVRDVNTRLDAQVIRQVDSNTKSIEKLDDRVQTLERSVKTP